MASKISSSDKKMTQDESGGLKRSQKEENAWRSEGPKDPVAMVCVFVCEVMEVRTTSNKTSLEIDFISY